VRTTGTPRSWVGQPPSATRQQLCKPKRTRRQTISRARVANTRPTCPIGTRRKEHDARRRRCCSHTHWRTSGKRARGDAHCQRIADARWLLIEESSYQPTRKNSRRRLRVPPPLAAPAPAPRPTPLPPLLPYPSVPQAPPARLSRRTSSPITLSTMAASATTTFGAALTARPEIGLIASLKDNRGAADGQVLVT
jgi:hypothetical protein